MLTICILLFTVQTNPGISTAPSMLSVCGSSIVNEEGHEVMLRGMNMDCYYYLYDSDPEAPFDYASEEDIEYLAGIGCNSLRLCLNWKMFETDAGFRLIDDYLSWCEPLGVYIILDMHIVPPGSRASDRGIWSSTDARDQLCELWRSIALRYADRACIAGYDLFNEPSPHEAQQWWDLAHCIAGAIREVDSAHILFIESSSWNGAGLRIIDDPNAVYSFHSYEPFVISHATASWPGDSPVPDDYSYPGAVLTGMQWVGWSSGVTRLNRSTSDWIHWESGVITVPRGVEWVSIKAQASGEVGSVLFDGLRLLQNGTEQEVVNRDIEETSYRRPGQPTSWYFYRDSGDFVGTFSDDSFTGTGSLGIAGSSGSGSWIQTRSFYTGPLFRVQPGDVLEVSGMIKAPQNAGEIMLGLDYLRGNYEDYDVNRLRDGIQDIIDWARSSDVPLYIGEFGALPGADPQSRYNFVTDWLRVMNEEGLHWAFWTYRNPDEQAFGLWYQSSILDVRLADILSAAYGVY